MQQQTLPKMIRLRLAKHPHSFFRNLHRASNVSCVSQTRAAQREIPRRPGKCLLTQYGRCDLAICATIMTKQQTNRRWQDAPDGPRFGVEIDAPPHVGRGLPPPHHALARRPQTGRPCLKIPGMSQAASSPDAKTQRPARVQGAHWPAKWQPRCRTPSAPDRLRAGLEIHTCTAPPNMQFGAVHFNNQLALSPRFCSNHRTRRRFSDPYTADPPSRDQFVSLTPDQTPNPSPENRPSSSILQQSNFHVQAETSSLA
jgi:hypothetical protein